MNSTSRSWITLWDLQSYELSKYLQKWKEKVQVSAKMKSSKSFQMSTNTDVINRLPLYQRSADPVWVVVHTISIVHLHHCKVLSYRHTPLPLFILLLSHLLNLIFTGMLLSSNVKLKFRMTKQMNISAKQQVH